ncbi:MAG: hypothetical protein ACD_64C00122G0002 [uncultured bacterium]|nr:MAG: hypothetical protein ACD_64C00122G0002 [uncultured bacterium]
MKRHIVFALCLSSLAYAESKVLQGISFFSPRSQTIDMVRYQTGSHPYTHLYESTSFNGVFKVTPEYKRSYHAVRIAQALFGTDRLFISGSEVETRNPNAMLADYFGLSPSFQSEVCLNPHIKNFIFTLSGYFGFDNWIPGLYAAIHAPITWTKWDFKMEETIFNSGSGTQFPALYMDSVAVDPAYASFKDALVGNKTYGQMTNPLAFGKICGSQTKAGLSDLLLLLGYDVIATENGYAGFNIRLSAPTGTRPNSKYFFEPIIGNGKHWELGGGFSGKVLLWEADGLQELSLFADVNLTHLFKTRQTRSFDFCNNGFGSRFILLKEFADGNYTGALTPAINVTSLSCDVSVGAQMEFLAMFGYTYKGLEFDIGYNGWLRSHENISLRDCIPDHTYGLKGIQDATDAFGNPSNLTQSNATLYGNLLSQQGDVVDADSPQFIRTQDLNLESAASELVLTHKLFFYLGYGWQESDRDHFVPFLGFGSSIEFEGINDPDEKQPNRNTLAQWGLWIQAGCAFK